jgi:glycine betaine/proline transport system permease protein
VIPAILAQGVSIWDNSILDRWTIPFGQWADQAVDWIDNNLQTLLDVIEWPFDTLISTLVDDFLVPLSWVWVVLGMGLIAALVRNIKVAAFVMVSLTICGILGNAYWIETARTIGFIAVAVLLCVIIGIPVGVAAGRVDGLWQVTRPILDGMQVIHSFVYMLPFIFFWGIGEVSATMVTMIFALPPLIRLTNLGIRQVPDDVVEAARAHGAPEWRVLLDVQLPLARPAIMTGINQTLLLAISMLGIAAIMGAGGLGRLLFRALSNQSVALGASAGLAFFLVAVVLDRMSQREDTDQGNLFQRIRLAWKHRRDPEALLPDGKAVVEYEPAERYEPVTARERSIALVALLGGAVATVAVFLPWASDSGKITAYGFRADEDLTGQTFNGLDASGGSFFGILVLVFGLFVVLSVFYTLLRAGRGPRWFAADGAVIGAFGALITSGAFLMANPSQLAVDPGTGIGLVLAIVGGGIATVASVVWIRVAPHSPLHPLRADISWGRLIGVVVSVLIVVMGAFAAWSFDGRTDVVLSPEDQQRIEDLEAQAAANPADAAVIANDIANIQNAARATGAEVIDGVSPDGAQLGLWSMILAGLAVLTTIPAIGVLGVDEHRRWLWSTITAGLGTGIGAIAFAWIFTFVRRADPTFYSGVGSFLSMMGGMFILASTMSVLREFRRSRVYDDEPAGDTESVAEEPVEELV